MEDERHVIQSGVCPHVDVNDRRCGSRFSLGRLEQAFGVCFGTYHVCPMYHQINQERTERRETVASRMLPLVTVTNNGCDVPLRATGT